MITQTTNPYQLLVRWNDQGKLQGVSVQHLTVYKDDETIIQKLEGQPIDLSVSGEDIHPAFAELVGNIVIQQAERIGQLERQLTEQPTPPEVPATGPNLSGLLNELVTTPYFGKAKQRSAESLPVNVEFTLLMGGLTSTELSQQNRMATVLMSMAALESLLGLTEQEQADLAAMRERYGVVASI